MLTPQSDSPVLTISMGALRANYRLLREKAGMGACAGVVKANGYGLGVATVAEALEAEGCPMFFVATLSEALELRTTSTRPIAVFAGCTEATAPLFAEHGLLPVINSLHQLEIWRVHAAASGYSACLLHVDTGMRRLGLDDAETAILLANPALLSGLDVRYLMTHLACTDEPDHPLNAAQAAAMQRLKAAFPQIRQSIANSSGLFDARFASDLARPGMALYGPNPTPWAKNPMQPVVALHTPILQVRRIDSGMGVGYGSSWVANRPSAIATVPVGYADGYLRSLSNQGHMALGGVTVPVIGRVSMDLITLDVTDVPPHLTQPGAMVEVIGDTVTLDDVAQAAGTIPYEILTSLGRRYRREVTA